MATITIKVEGVEQVLAKLKKLPHQGGVKAGVLDNEKSGGGEVLDYAPIQEFGGVIPVTKKMRGYFGAVFGVHLRKDKAVITIPSRPFMRLTYQDKHKEWLQDLIKGIKAGIDENTLWELIGTRMMDDIQATIRSNLPPANSSLTRAIKEKEYPTHANDTLRMSDKLHNSIDYEVLK